MPHVLIAHTSIGARTLLKIMFERMRYPMDIAASPAEALTTASQHIPDLAILDIAFGDVSGFDVADELRALYPNLPIMMFTSPGQTIPSESLAKRDQKDISIHTHGPTMDLYVKVRSLVRSFP